MSRPEHTFVVPAYGRSAYLRDCLESLSRQSVPSPIIVTSSTPHEGLQELSREFGAELVTHAPSSGIGRDWNFAVSQARTPWVTIAHQDDVYLPEFTTRTLAAAAAHADAILICTAYRDLVGDQVRPVTRQSFMKRALSEVGFLGRRSIRTRRAKRRLLRYGCPISCPTVTLKISEARIQFREDLQTNLDWEAWFRLSSQSGSFVYLRDRLILCRIHAMSGTSQGIRSGARPREDEMMFRLFWPEPMVRMIMRAYSFSYDHHGPTPGGEVPAVSQRRDG